MFFLFRDSVREKLPIIFLVIVIIQFLISNLPYLLYIFSDEEIELYILLYWINYIPILVLAGYLFFKRESILHVSSLVFLFLLLNVLIRSSKGLVELEFYLYSGNGLRDIWAISNFISFLIILMILIILIITYEKGIIKKSFVENFKLIDRYYVTKIYSWYLLLAISEFVRVRMFYEICNPSFCYTPDNSLYYFLISMLIIPSLLLHWIGPDKKWNRHYFTTVSYISIYLFMISIEVVLYLQSLQNSIGGADDFNFIHMIQGLNNGRTLFIFLVLALIRVILKKLLYPVNKELNLEEI